MQLYSHYQKSIPAPTAKEWNNYSVNDALLYSHRSTAYRTGDFPSNLHYHDYYELIFVARGDIGYICESRIYYPQKWDAILISPGKFHMSVINAEETQYDRHVFYFYPTAFDAYESSCLCKFAKDENETLIPLSDEQKQKASQLLQGLSSALSASENEMERALGISYILQLFYLLNQTRTEEKAASSALPDGILHLKNYIDGNYASIASVSDVAKQFFYSREHASRLFKQHFDITISEYILHRRILESQKMIASGASVTDTAYAVGFNSISAFIRGFRKVTGIAPSEYRRQCTHKMAKRY